MCELYSWIEKDGQVLFLTPRDIWETTRGIELQKHTPRFEDWHGHGAIRWYYRLKGGIEKECTDFSSPGNFPSELVREIKAGNMWRLGITSDMHVMLTQPARAEYEKVTQAACAEYKKVEKAAWAEYEKVEKAACAEYEKVTQAAWAEYEKVQKPAWAEYEKVTQAACAEYKKVEKAAWATIFSDPTNRIESWK